MSQQVKFPKFFASFNIVARTMAVCLLCVCSMRGMAQNSGETLGVDAQTKDIISYVQHVMGFNRTVPQEKVYMHFDNTGYFEGETIWFKAYVTRTDNGHPTDLSKVLYVELLNPSGDVIKTQKYYINEQGQAHGDMKVDSLFGSGFYEVRAYTRYMTNWGVNAVFSRVFPVFGKPAEEGNYTDLSIDTRLYKERNPNNRDQQDSLYMKAVKEGIYSDNTMKTVSVQFYPEGGDMVQGKKCHVAMLAVTDDGRPYHGQGFVVNKQGDVLASVETDTLGRGDFTVIPDASELTMKMMNAQGREQIYTLPAARREGCALTLDVVNDDVLATLQSSSGVCGELIGYVLMNNGNIYHCDTLVAAPLMELELNREQMKEGVNQMTVFNSNGQVLADRLFFIYPKPSEEDSITFKTETTWLKPCGKVTLDVQTLPNATFSFSAMDAGTMPNEKQGNLKTWMLLSSEVRGYIDHVDYYFESDDKEHRKAADMLMLTQGWRRYNWNEMAGLTPREKMQPVEDKFYVFGKLNEYRKRNPVNGVDMQLILYNQQGQSLTGNTKTDKDGNYVFGLPFLDGEWKMFFYTTIKDKKKTFRVGVDRQISPTPRYISPVEASLQMPTGANMFVHQEDEPVPDGEEFIPITQKNFVLENVTVKAKRRYFTNDDFKFKNENYARRWASVYYDIDRELDNIRDRGEEEPTIFEFLAKKNMMFNNPECIDLPVVSGDTASWSEWYGHMAYGNQPIQWIVDNGETMNAGAITSESGAAGDTFFPQWMDEIKSVYIAPYDPDQDSRDVAKGALGEDPSAVADDRSNFVKIYLYLHHRFTTESNKGIRRTYFQGFNEISTFEMEDYSVIPPMADFRRTIFWAPDVKADEQGKAKIEFFNNSTCEEMYISAEGMTPTGRMVVKD